MQSRARAADGSQMKYDDNDHYPHEYNVSSNDLAGLEDSKAVGQVKGKARKAAAQDARAKTASEAVLKAQQVVEMLDNLPWPTKQPPRKGDAVKVPTSTSSVSRVSRFPSDSKSSASKFKTAPEPIIRRNNSNNTGNRNDNEHHHDNTSSSSNQKNNRTANDRNIDSQKDNNMDEYTELLEFPDADNAPPPIIETKKKSKSSFREFLDKGSFPKVANSAEPGISLLYKAPDGTVATAVHMASSTPLIEEAIPDNNDLKDVPVPRVDSHGTLDTRTPMQSTHPNQVPMVRNIRNP